MSSPWQWDAADRCDLGFGLASGIDLAEVRRELHPDQPGHWAGIPGVGAPVAWLTRNVVGPLLMAAGLCHLISAAATMMAVFGLNADWPTSRSAPCRPSPTGRQFGIGLLFPLALLLFPDGRAEGGCGWLADRAERRFPGRDRSLSDGSSFSDSKRPTRSSPSGSSRRSGRPHRRDC